MKLMQMFLIAVLLPSSIVAITKEQFQTRYVEQWLDKTEVAMQPEFVIVFGPCGSGKTSVRQRIDHLRELDAVEVNIDEMMKEYSTLVMGKSSSDSMTNKEYLDMRVGLKQTVYSELIERSKAERRNIIIETTGNDTALKIYIESLVEANYRVKIYVIAASVPILFHRTRQRQIEENRFGAVELECPRHGLCTMVKNAFQKTLPIYQKAYGKQGETIYINNCDMKEMGLRLLNEEQSSAFLDGVLRSAENQLEFLRYVCAQEKKNLNWVAEARADQVMAQQRKCGLSRFLHIIRWRLCPKRATKCIASVQQRKSA